jgi:hypothetical protein
VKAPDEMTWRRYVECATMSYPYDPGGQLSRDQLYVPMPMLNHRASNL